MTEVKIYTNHHWREIQYDVPGWVEDGSLESYFVYRGERYWMSEFEWSTQPGWDGQKAETFFSAVLFKMSEDNDYVKVGLLIA